MQVVAKTLGFYDNKRRREGEVFELKAGHKLGSWMKPVKGEAKEEAKAKSKGEAKALKSESEDI